MFFVIVILVKNPFIQTALARVATNYLETKLNTTVKIARLDINLLKRITLKELLILDRQHDTLLYTGELTIGWKKLGIKNTSFEPKFILLNDADVRLKNYKGDEGLNYSFIIDFFSGGETLPADTIQTEPVALNFSLEKLSISNCRFVYEDQNDTVPFEGINFSDIDLRMGILETSDLRISGDSIFADILNLSFREKSGFKVDSLSGNFIYCPTLLQADNLLVRTENNNLNLDVKFTYESMASFNDFIHSVNIQANIRPTILNLYDVGYFAPILFQMNNITTIEGKISGTVDNFKTRDFKFSFGDVTQFNGNIQMNGLPDFFGTFIHLSIADLNTSAQDIANFNLPISGNRLQLPLFLNKLGVIDVAGKFTGFYNDFVSYAKFTTDLGRVNTDLLLKVNSNDDIEYKGKIATQNLDVGTLFEMESLLKKLTLQAEIRGQGLDFETMDLTIDGMIQSFDFYNNTYNAVDIAGNLSDKKFNGNINVIDELIKLDFTGIIDYSQVVPAYKFNAVVDSAQLNQMNLVNRDSLMYLSTKLDIDLSGNQFDNLQGIIKLDSTRYWENGKLYPMDDFTLSVTRDGYEYALLRIFSDIADVSVEGEFLFREMPNLVQSFMNQFLDTVFVDLSVPADIAITQDFIFDVEVKNLKPITELFYPPLQIAPGTRITGGFNSKINNLFMDAGSSEIIYSGIKFKNFNAELLVQNNDLVLTTFSDQVLITDSISIDSIKSSFSLAGDTISFAMKWNNQNWETSNYGDLAGNFVFFSPTDMKFKLTRGEIVINDTIWEINPANNLKIDSTSLTFSNFGLNTSEQGLFLNGKISHNPVDTLTINFDRFNLSNSDKFFIKSGIDLDGLINGNFNIIDFYETPNYLADLTISDLGFNKEKLGEAIIKSEWDPKNEAFNLLAQIIYEGNIGKNKTLEVAGSFYPYKEESNYDININLNNYKLKTVEPFIKDFSSKISGEATGAIKLSGSTNQPVLTGSINLKRTQLKIDYLNVTYSLADQINFKENLIYFDNITVYDTVPNKAIASGKVTHRYFKDFNLDLNFTTDKLVGLNTNRTQNNTFYGTAVASGTIRIAGPPDNLTMDINVKSEKGTNIKLPASYGNDIAENNFIVYMTENDVTSSGPKKYEVDLKGLALNLGLNVTHDANIQLFLPYQMGNIQASGKGDLIMNIDAAGNFKMEGQYVIDKGSFFLTLQNIINRDFDIKRGSNIAWAGDPYNAQINLKAVYKVKTTLGEYAPIEDSATRVQVNCVIALTKSLFNPDIRFTIEFPDMKEDSKQYIYSQLDTTDQALMSQQMISLLLLNSFYFPSGTTGSVGFNTFSLVTNQLNNWLSGFSDNFDIGVNYIPGGQVSSDEVEVALSTRLFDNRVTIDGNLGVKGKESTSALIGEVTVEYKITDDGRFRTKVFNKSNNDDLNKNYSPYTQGVGIFYTQDFSRFGDLFRKKNKKGKQTEKERKNDQSMLEQITAKLKPSLSLPKFNF